MSDKNKIQLEYTSPHKLKYYHRQLRKPKKQVEKTIRLYETCGSVLPVVVDDNDVIIVGWHLAEAARQMNLDEVPVIRINQLDEEQVRILRIAYDRIAEEAEWDKNALAEEFRELEILIPDIDLTLTGFEIPEIDITINLNDENPDDQIPDVEKGPSVTKPEDLWTMDDHKLFCGDALLDTSYSALMGDEKAQMCFTDPPYNVKIQGHVSGNGRHKHDEFAMAAGEMNKEEFTTFLSNCHKNIAACTEDGAIIFSCMDWRHIQEITAAAANAKLTTLNLCVWVKDNGGMGSLYRSRHELVFVFKNGNERHINNVELGKYGRYRTNVWEFPRPSGLIASGAEELAMHPTCKPVSLICEAIKDCSKRGGIILDPFGGSGSTLIAAEKTRRKARLIELDGHYCDVIIRRWQEMTGENAIHTETGKTFNELKQEQGGSDDE